LRKHLPLVILVVIVVLVIGGYLGYSSLKQEHSPPAGGDIKVAPPKIVGDDTPSIDQPEITDKEKKDSLSNLEDSNIPNSDPNLGETVVWGEIKAVDVDKRVLTVDQHMDDNSIKISPNVPVLKEAIIRTKEEVISLAQVKPGDTVGIIVTREGQARAVLVNY